MKNKSHIALIGLGLVLLFIIGLSFQKLILESGSQDEPINIVPQDNPPVPYNAEKTMKMENIFRNRPKLSSEDKAARELLALRKNPLRKTENFSLEYLSSPDEFMVEILTPEIGKAKEETAAWLSNQGISQEGICNLPVVFYLNSDVAESLRGKSIEFDPLPLGC